MIEQDFSRGGSVFKKNKITKDRYNDARDEFVFEFLAKENSITFPVRYCVNGRFRFGDIHKIVGLSKSRPRQIWNRLLRYKSRRENLYIENCIIQKIGYN